MKLTNRVIYQYAQRLTGFFDNTSTYIPVKANFYIQKNISTLMEKGQEIETARIQIVSHYGELNEEQKQYIIPSEKIVEANREINDLFSIEQEVDIKMIKIEDLGNTEFTPQQMQALMFMIEE